MSFQLLGTTVASRLKVMLIEALDKVNPCKNMSSVRLLLPLEIPTSTGNYDPTFPSFMQLKDYQVLRRYGSFRIMNEKDLTQLHSDGFVDPVEVVDVLELNPISLSQETAGTSTGSVTGAR